VAFTPVPQLIEHGADEAGFWIVTSALPRHMSVTAR